jgi:BioD-like phosphotransacetylase family protein
MVMIYLGSVRAYAGKNMVALGLGRRLMADGFSLAYCKPYGANPVKVDGAYTDGDAWLINQALGLKQSPKECCTVLRTQDLISDALRGKAEGLVQKVVEHCNALARGKDVLLLSGAGTLRSGAMVGISGYTVAMALRAKVVIVEPYENEFFLDDLLAAANRLGEATAGVIINKVDKDMNAALDEQVAPFLKIHGVTTFGRLPKDELLSSVTVQELSDHLGAKPVCCLKQMDRLVKRFLIGAMQVSHAQRFFGHDRDFACIVGGDRPDMQIAALEGGAACMILTGNFYPNELIISKAEEFEVPVLVVRDDTFSVARALEVLRTRGSLQGPEKLQRAMDLVSQGLDFDLLYEKLGLKK